MKTLQHVLWRGALALGLMTIGVGTGIGMPPAPAVNKNACAGQSRILIVRAQEPNLRDQDKAIAVVVRRGIRPVDRGS